MRAVVAVITAALNGFTYGNEPVLIDSPEDVALQAAEPFAGYCFLGSTFGTIPGIPPCHFYC